MDIDLRDYKDCDHPDYGVLSHNKAKDKSGGGGRPVAGHLQVGQTADAARPAAVVTSRRCQTASQRVSALHRAASFGNGRLKMESHHYPRGKLAVPGRRRLSGGAGSGTTPTNDR